jgi:hypothetical protein
MRTYLLCWQLPVEMIPLPELKRQIDLNDILYARYDDASRVLIALRHMFAHFSLLEIDDRL